MTIDGLSVDITAGVLSLTFDRPERLNSLSVEIISATSDAIDDAQASGARVIVLSGSGRAFSSGADVGADGRPPGLDTLDAGNRLATTIAESPLIVVAA
ncbi:MAG: enoyl-CoA hydratase-related protein, partial [bacterium]|nr:enoyl-CoA hydratase-related protein [bacterium]